MSQKTKINFNDLVQNKQSSTLPTAPRSAYSEDDDNQGGYNSGGYNGRGGQRQGSYGNQYSSSSSSSSSSQQQQKQAPTEDDFPELGQETKKPRQPRTQNDNNSSRSDPFGGARPSEGPKGDENKSSEERDESKSGDSRPYEARRVQSDEKSGDDDREQGGYNRGGYGDRREGGYNRGGYGGNRDGGDREQGGYNRGGYGGNRDGGEQQQQRRDDRFSNGVSPFNFKNNNNREGGDRYNNNRNSGDRDQQQQGGYRGTQEGGERREGGFNRGGYGGNREGGEQRSSNPFGGERRSYGDRDNQQREGGFNRGGYGNREGGDRYNRDAPREERKPFVSKVDSVDDWRNPSEDVSTNAFANKQRKPSYNDQPRSYNTNNNSGGYQRRDSNDREPTSN